MFNDNICVFFYLLSWIKNQSDSAVIRATHLVGVGHLLMNVYEYGQVNMALCLTVETIKFENIIILSL